MDTLQRSSLVSSPSHKSKIPMRVTRCPHWGGWCGSGSSIIDLVFLVVLFFLLICPVRALSLSRRLHEGEVSWLSALMGKVSWPPIVKAGVSDARCLRWGRCSHQWVGRPINLLRLMVLWLIGVDTLLMQRWFARETAVLSKMPEFVTIRALSLLFP